MRRILLLILLSASIVSLARTVKTVSADYTFYAPESMSVEEAKHIAIEHAKVQALANEFGTNVSQSNSTVISNRNGDSDSRFFSFGGSEVRGEWIETIGTPEFEIIHEENRMIVSVKVKGKVREKSASLVDLSIVTLRNGVDKRFASTEFKDGDEFFINFSSPAKGYLSIWLVADNENSAYRLLPYQRSEKEVYPVSANIEYTFFSPSRCSSSDETAYVDEFEISTDQELEFNQLYVIFSPHPFAPVTQKIKEGGVHYSSAYSFREWLARFRRNNDDAVVRTFLIKISK